MKCLLYALLHQLYNNNRKMVLWTLARCLVLFYSLPIIRKKEIIFKRNIFQFPFHGYTYCKNNFRIRIIISVLKKKINIMTKEEKFILGHNPALFVPKLLKYYAK